jgi:hypothetical protein
MMSGTSSSTTPAQRSTIAKTPTADATAENRRIRSPASTAGVKKATTTGLGVSASCTKIALRLAKKTTVSPAGKSQGAA